MIRAALGWITGGSVTRLTATLLAGIAIGGWSGWQVQGWRQSHLRAQAVQQQSRDQLRQVENQHRASAAHQAEQAHADQQHIKIVERVRVINSGPAGAVQCLSDDGLRALAAAIDNGAPAAPRPGLAMPPDDKAD